MDRKLEDRLAMQVVEAAERGYPNDREAQIRNVAAAGLTGLGIGVTLRALKIITERAGFGWIEPPESA